MLHQDYFSKEYWQKAVIPQLPIEQYGWTRCKDWSQKAFELPNLPEEFVIQEADLGFLALDLYWHPKKMHFWLEAPKEGRIFVADAHAGQYDVQYNKGFFGFLDEASDILQKVYLQRI